MKENKKFKKKNNRLRENDLNAVVIFFIYSKKVKKRIGFFHEMNSARYIKCSILEINKFDGNIRKSLLSMI